MPSQLDEAMKVVGAPPCRTLILAQSLGRAVSLAATEYFALQTGTTSTLCRRSPSGTICRCGDSLLTIWSGRYHSHYIPSHNHPATVQVPLKPFSWQMDEQGPYRELHGSQ